jgi:hypothetical protein
VRLCVQPRAKADLRIHFIVPPSEYWRKARVAQSPETRFPREPALLFPANFLPSLLRLAFQINSSNRVSWFFRSIHAIANEAKPGGIGDRALTEGEESGQGGVGLLKLETVESVLNLENLNMPSYLRMRVSRVR